MTGGKDIDTSPGQSGSAIWYETGGNHYIVGVHTWGEDVVGEGNFGVRIDENIMMNILGWMARTVVVSVPAPLGGAPDTFDGFVRRVLAAGAPAMQFDLAELIGRIGGRTPALDAQRIDLYARAIASGHAGARPRTRARTPRCGPRRA